MKYKNSTVTMSPEILKRKLGGELLVPITVDDTAFDSNGVCKAGTALTADGKKGVETAAASGAAASNTAVGILLYDVLKAENPNGSLVKGFAAVSKAAIKASTGTDVTDGVVNTLSNIDFE